MRRVKIKPGKGPSMMGLVVGILFCLIGIFVAIPSAGLFGVFWTLMAVVITVSNGINAFSEKGITSHEIIIDQEEHTGNTQAASKTDLQKRLELVDQLYAERSITKEEYDQKRKEILDEI